MNKEKRKKELNILLENAIDDIGRVTETVRTDEANLLLLDEKIEQYKEYRNELKTLK